MEAENDSISEHWMRRSNSAPGEQFLFLFGLVCLGFLLAIIVTVFAVALTPGTHFQDLRSSAQPYFLTIAMLVIQDVCMFVLPAVYFARSVRRRNDYFYFKPKITGETLLLVLLIAFAAIPCTDLFGRLNEMIPLSPGWSARFHQMEDDYARQAMSVIRLDSFGQYLLSLIVMAAIPAICEELIFRGALQQVLIKWFRHPFIGILVTAVIFSAIHLSFFGFLPRAFLGMILGYIFYYGKNIKLNMLAHFINNGTVVTTLYIYHIQHKSIENAMDAKSPLSVQVIGIMVLLFVFYLFIQKRRKADAELVERLD